MGDHDICPSCGGQSLEAPLAECTDPLMNHAEASIVAYVEALQSTRCLREYAHGPHLYNAVGVAEKRQCPGRGRKPLRALRMWFHAAMGSRSGRLTVFLVCFTLSFILTAAARILF